MQNQLSRDKIHMQNYAESLTHTSSSNFHFTEIWIFIEALIILVVISKETIHTAHYYHLLGIFLHVFEVHWGFVLKNSDTHFQYSDTHDCNYIRVEWLLEFATNTCRLSTRVYLQLTQRANGVKKNQKPVLLVHNLGSQKAWIFFKNNLFNHQFFAGCDFFSQKKKTPGINFFLFFFWKF